MITIEQIRIPAEPSEPRLSRPLPFEDRSGIDVNARNDPWALGSESGCDRTSLGENRVVIVGAECVGRNATAQLRAPIATSRGGRGVRVGEADNRA